MSRLNNQASGRTRVLGVPGRYPLAPESIGEDTYVVISRGHHEIHAFMAEVRKHWSWPLGVPEHIWMKTLPARTDGYSCWYQPVPAGTRGAWPCTYVREAYNEDSYESRFLQGEQAAT